MKALLPALHSAVIIMTPLLFAATGGLFPALAGMLNIALEGLLLIGAFSAIAAVYYTGSFAAGLGWNSLAAALVAGFYPPALIPASLFFAWISSGARIAMQNSDITFEVGSIVQAVIFFLVTSIVLRNLFAKKERRQ